MSSNKEILFGLIDLWAEQHQLYSIQCTVKSVNGRTCDVTPNNGSADILDVNLEADSESSDSKGFFIIPAIGSNVIVTFTSKDYGYISAFTEINNIVAKQGEWIFNDGNNLGLVKVTELTNRLNDLESLFNQLQQDLSSWTPIAQDGGAALKAIISAGFGIKIVPNSSVSDFENEDIKH